MRGVVQTLGCGKNFPNNHIARASRESIKYNNVQFIARFTLLNNVCSICNNIVTGDGYDIV